MNFCLFIKSIFATLNVVDRPMKAKSLLKLASLFSLSVILLSLSGCNNSNTNTVVSFLPLEGSCGAYGTAYHHGINYFLNNNEELNFEYINYDDSKIEETLKNKNTKAIIGSFNDELNNSVTSNNDIPIITSFYKPIDYEYNADKAFFPLIPSLTKEAEALGDLMLLDESITSVGVLFSDEECYEEMYITLSEKLGHNIFVGYELDAEHDAYSAMLDIVIADNHDALVLFTNIYDFNNLIYKLAIKDNETAVYAPSYIKRFFNVPPNYNEDKFSIYYPKFTNSLNINEEELNATFTASEYYEELNPTIKKRITDNFSFFVDGYLAVSILNSAINEIVSKLINTKELTKLLHKNELFKLEAENLVKYTKS